MQQHDAVLLRVIREGGHIRREAVVCGVALVRSNEQPAHVLGVVLLNGTFLCFLWVADFGDVDPSL